MATTPAPPTRPHIPRSYSLLRQSAMLLTLCASLGWLAFGCGDATVLIPGCEVCPETCLQKDDGRARCVACLNDEQCRKDATSTKLCNRENKCVCGSDKDCPGATHCSADKGCVECIEDTHCTDQERPLCTPENSCVSCLVNTTEACTPTGLEVCAPGVRRCKANGQWDQCLEYKRCADDETCVDQKCVKTCPQAPCQEGEKQCTSAAGVTPGTYKECAKDAKGCLAWSQQDQSCGADQICQDSACAPKPCDNECKEGETRCQGQTEQQTCEKDAKGCLKWAAKTPCQQGQQCVDSLKRCAVCAPGSQTACYTGPAGTQNKGVCTDGTKTCQPDGSAYSACTGDTIPSQEVCDKKDNDCDGDTDEGCDCLPGQKQACGNQPQGECKQGEQTCGSDGKWGACIGEIKPSPEVCDKKDNDCNGTIDEGCECLPGDQRACGNQPQGECKQGSQSCSSNGKWGACLGEIGPTPEICDGKDNDCDGMTDEALSRACYAGPPGTEGTGPCKKGTQICQSGVWSTTCSGQVIPIPEICLNQIDDDCDGIIDEADGRAVALGGGKDNLSFPHHSAYDLAGSFTLEFWLYFDGLGSRPIALLLNKHQAQQNHNGYHLKIQNENNVPTLGFSWWNQSGGNQLLFGPCPIKQWTHIAFVYDHTSQTYRFFVNGTLATNGQGTKAITIGTNSHPLYFGTETPPAQSPAADVQFRGQIAALRLSKSARYTTTFQPACTWATDAQTTGLWNLDDGAGTKLTDRSTNANHGTATGTWTQGRNCNLSATGGCTP